MDLIGSIKLIENTLGRRNSSQPQTQLGSKTSLHHSEKNPPKEVDTNHFSVWDELQVGKNIDTVA